MRREHKTGHHSNDIFFVCELEKLESQTLVLQQTQKRKTDIGVVQQFERQLFWFPLFHFPAVRQNVACTLKRLHLPFISVLF